MISDFGLRFRVGLRDTTPKVLEISFYEFF